MALSARSKRKAPVSNDIEQIIKVRKDQREPARNRNLLADDSVFGDLMSEAGATLSANSRPVELSKEPALFQRSLQQLLKKHLDYPQVIGEFVDGFSKQVDCVKRLQSFLLPTVTKSEDYPASSRSGVIQDSPIKLLLNIDLLQPKLVPVLLEKLVEVSMDCGSADTVSIPRLILNQFQWLGRIVESKELVDKMFEVLTVVSIDIQREIIACIPDVVDDAQHIGIADQLEKLMVSDSRLTVPVLDVLSNLNLSPDLLTTVRISVVSTLPSADIDDVPVIVRFLLQTVTPADAYQVMCDIRENVDLSTISPAMAAPGGSKTSVPKKDGRGSELLVLDAIRSGIRFQKFVAEAALKALESIKSSGDCRVIDIILLLILHSSGYKKPVESICRAKITSGILTESILQSAFTCHAEVIREYFTSILLVAEVLLRSSQPIVADFASAIYRQAFVSFDAYCRQEIVGNLVMHIGSGSAVEVELSLDILLDLVNHHIKLMAPFAVFTKSMLDYIDNLDLSEIRKLYAVLCRLAFSPSSGDSMIQDAVHIMVRKQFSSNIIQYQLMGVTGAVMIIRNLAERSGGATQDIMSDIARDSSDLGEGMSNEVYEQAVNLLQLVKNSCARSPLASALFMEELAIAIREGIIHQKIEEWFSENVINDFQDDFIIDIVPEDKHGEGDLPWSFQFGLDEESEGSIGVNLLPLVHPSRLLATSHTDNTASRTVSVWCLASHFRLLQTCEKRQHAGNLEGIDALLGCAVKLPKFDDLVDKLACLSSKERVVLCDSIFLSLNWFLELVNAFSCQNDIEMKAKVITRFRDISELLQKLDKILPECPGYSPPPACFGVTPDSKPLVKSSKKAVTGKKKQKKKKKKITKKGKEKDADEDADDDDVDDDDDNSDHGTDESRNDSRNDKDSTVTEETSTTCAPAAVISSSVLSMYLRELDFDVFGILRVGLITRTDLDTNMNTKDTETLQLELPQLRFLLEDLARKLDHVLISSASKRKSFLKPKVEKSVGFRNIEQLGAIEVVRRTVDLLPALCQHFESTSAFFQSLIDANDGVLDGPGFSSDESQLMAACLHLLIRILHSLFAWNGLSATSNRDLLQRSLAVLAGRLTTNNNSQLSFNNLVEQSYKYVENFIASTPTLPAAVSLCKLLCCIAAKVDDDETRLKTGELALSMLQLKWHCLSGQTQKGAAHNELLQSLLQIAFLHAEDVQKVMDDFVNSAIPELQQADKEEGSSMYPTLTRSSYPVFYRTILQELVDLVKGIKPGKSTDPIQENVQKLVKWNNAVRTFHSLVNLVKVFDASANLGTLLKNGRMFIDVFIQQGMPMLDHMFRVHRDDIQGLLKNLQLSTRALHHLCGHSKITKAVSLTNQVPQLKRALEGFVYRVKAMLTINRCLEAFWLGNLKNRTIKGEEIVSQKTQAEPVQSSSDEESLPEDEESDDEGSVMVAPPKKAAKKVTTNSDDEDEQEAEDDDMLQSYSETY